MNKLSSKFNLAQWFFLALSIIVLIIFWQVIQPFAIVLATAAIFAIVLTPIDNWLRRYLKWETLSALFISFGVFLVVFVPLFIVSVLIVQQADSVVDWSLSQAQWLRTFDVSSSIWFLSLPAAVQDQILAIDFVAAGQDIAKWAGDHLGDIFSRSVQMIYHTAIFFIALFYFLVDRARIYQMVLDLSPFKNKLDADVLKRMTETVRSVVFGAVIIAVIQATLAAIGMTIFGVPGALLWGALVAVASQVPVFGVGTVMIPAVVYLFLTGNIGAAIGLAIWSAVVVGLVDNFLSPIIIGAKTKMPQLLVLISILGALQLFGPIGFILGPTILAAVMVIIDLYRSGILESEIKHGS